MSQNDGNSTLLRYQFNQIQTFSLNIQINLLQTEKNIKNVILVVIIIKDQYNYSKYQGKQSILSFAAILLLLCYRPTASQFAAYPSNSILLEMQKNKNAVQSEIVKYRLLNPSVQQKLNLLLEETLNSYRKNEINSTMEIQEPQKICEEEEKFSKINKKVSFESLPMRATHSSGKINRSILKGSNPSTHRKNTYPLHSKTVSLNCSIVKPFAHRQVDKSTRSVKSINPEGTELKSLMSQIIQKISVFSETQITNSQILEWLQSYCKRQKSILLRLFSRHRSIKDEKSRKIIKYIQELETDGKVLLSKVELKHKDIYSGVDRYIKITQLKQLSQQIELAFLDKMKIKVKEFEDVISKKMKIICQKIRKQKDNEYLINFRKKPTQISKFITDFYDFQQNFGSLKKINSLSKMRFKIFNDTDMLIDKRLRSINQNIQTQKMIQQQIRIIS